MARGRKRDHGKERYWRRVLRQWQRSGQSVRAFCSAYGLSEPSFYAWRRIIQEHDRLEGRGPVEGDGLPAFVPVTIAASPAPLEVVLRDGCVVRVPPHFDAATLRQLLGVLAEASSC
jgi:transposase-like protein